MVKTKKLLSLILCVAMVLTTLGALAPQAYAASAYDGSNTKLTLANTDKDTTGTTSLSYNVAGIGGKASSDVVYKITTADDNRYSDQYIIGPYIGNATSNSSTDMVKKGMLSMDVLLTSENSKIAISAGLWKALGTDSGFENNGNMLYIGASGLTSGRAIDSLDENAPTSLSLNEWHNIACVIENNGTTNIDIYIDGVKYTATLKTASYGVRHMRVSIMSGSIYADNYVCEYSDYDPTPYVKETVSVTGTDDIEYDADTKTVTVKNSYITVADVKKTITAAETSTVRVFADKVCSSALSDDDGLEDGGRIAIESASGAFSYLNIAVDGSQVSANEEGINKGDTNITIANTQTAYKYNEAEASGKYFFETTSSANVAGVGGKTADDVSVKINTKGSNDGYNFINTPVYNQGAMVVEFSVMGSDVFKPGVQLGYYKTETQETSVFNTVYPVEFKNNKLYVNKVEVAEAQKGRWYHIVLITPNIGSDDDGAVYVNGTRYSVSFPSAYYGARHIRIYSLSGDSLGTKTDESNGYTYTDYPTYNYYIDNYRVGKKSDINYKVGWDKAATLSSTDSAVRISEGNIAFDNEKTVSDLKENITVSTEDAAVRFYSDSTYATELSDSDTLTQDSVVVVAAKNGFSFERVYTYYTVNDPHINSTIFDYELKSDGTASVTGFKEDNIVATDDITAINIPETIAGYTVTEIASKAFYSDTPSSINHQIQSVVLPATVKKIGNQAFGGCKWSSDASNLAGSLKSVTLNEGLETIGDNAFSMQTKLVDFNLPSTLKSIGASAFYWTGIKEVSVPDSVTNLGSAAFSLCSSLTYVKLPNGITTIPEALMRASTAIKTIVIPSNITGKTNDAFSMSYDQTPSDRRPKNAIVYGAAGSYAETFAQEYDYEFVGLVADMLVAEKALLGDGTKELAGTSYDLDYGFKSITYNAKLSNLGAKDVDAKVIIALYDETGKMIKHDSKPISVKSGETVKVTNTNGPSISISELKDDYTVKGFVWRESNNEPIAETEEITFDKDKIEVHVLTIANSFCNDSFRYMQDIAKAGDVVIKTVNMYTGGAPLATHYNNIVNNGKYSNTVVNGNYLTADNVWNELASDRWNYIALQCATHGYSQDKNFLDYDNDTTKQMYEAITAKVKEISPNATRVMHMSWGPDNAQSKVMLKNVLNLDVEESVARGTLYEKQKAAYKNGASIFATDGKSVVPTSVAVQYAIEKYGILEHGYIDPNDPTVTVGGTEPKYQPTDEDGNPAIYRDATCHMTNPYGSVLVGLTWYEFLTGKDARENPYQEASIDAATMTKLKEAAHFANEHPDWTFGDLSAE